jgi:methionyl-tRNA formyltransferase
LLSGLELLNVHPSLLPRWRGAAPIERAIMAGDAETGVTIIRVAERLDSGPIALREAVPVGSDDYGALAARLGRLGAELLCGALDRLAGGELELVEQDDAGATYAEKISPDERRLDPGRPALELERVVRALTPHIGAYLELDRGDRLAVLAAEAEPGGEVAAGRLAADDGLLVGCAEGALRLHRVRPAGGREMDADAYLRGHPLPRLA